MKKRFLHLIPDPLKVFPILLLVLLLMSFNDGLSQAQAGGIAFVGFNSDEIDANAESDGLAFALLQDAPDGISIFFNDNAWNNNTNSFASSEGTVTWTNDTGSSIAAGTVVILDDLKDTETASIGSVTESGNFDISGTEEVVYAYLGTVTTPSLFLAAIANVDFSTDDDGSGIGSLNGTGLVAGQTAISITTDADGATVANDVMVYTGTVHTDCDINGFAACAEDFNTASNWLTDNGGGDQSQDGLLAEFPTPNGGGTGVISSFTDDAPAGGPLPVELSNFTANVKGKGTVYLSWSTASEENNSHFEIEHSTNARDFEAIGKVTGNGTSSEIQQYHYMHENAVAGKNYYRLRQVDFDGAFEYSSVVVVKLKGEGTVQIRPTLADEQVSLVFDEATRQEAQLQVFDITGRQITTALVTPGTEQFELPVANFTNGLYFIQLQLNGEFSTLKFIKR